MKSSPCLRGFHNWQWFDGRPAICLDCGAVGHPLGHEAFTRDMLGVDEDDMTWGLSWDWPGDVADPGPV